MKERALEELFAIIIDTQELELTDRNIGYQFGGMSNIFPSSHVGLFEFSLQNLIFL